MYGGAKTPCQAKVAPDISVELKPYQKGLALEAFFFVVYNDESHIQQIQTVLSQSINADPHMPVGNISLPEAINQCTSVSSAIRRGCKHAKARPQPRLMKRGAQPCLVNCPPLQQKTNPQNHLEGTSRKGSRQACLHATDQSAQWVNGENRRA